MGGIEYLVAISSLNRFEKQNLISINIYGIDKSSDRQAYEEEEEELPEKEQWKVFPMRITKMKNARDHVDLLYISNEDGDFHYVLIRDLERLVGVQISKSNRKKHICRYCLHACTTNEILQKHLERCQEHKAQRIKINNQQLILHKVVNLLFWIRKSQAQVS